MIRILVVEDNLGFRDALVELLKRQPDLEVMGTAGSLSEARTMLQATLEETLGGMDVALLDRGLPDGDGLEFFEELRALKPETRGYVMSATAEMRHPWDAIEAGVDGVIEKKEAPEQVFAAIRERGGGR